jgi:hypothetical protein
MATTQRIGEGLTFEKVWAAIQATNEQIKENDKRISKQIAETEQRLGKRIEETGRQLKKTDQQLKETGRQLKETDEWDKKQWDKWIGGPDRFGDMTEHMVIPNLVKKFDELGFTFTKANRTEITDRKHSIITDVDALLENGDKIGRAHV